MAGRERAGDAIPIIDVNLQGRRPWAKALEVHTRGAGKLVEAFNGQGEEAIGAAGWWTVKKAARALNGLLGRAYADEIEEIAGAVGVDPAEILLASAAYDLANAAGCSTVAAVAPRGPVLARNLDWTFPRGLLRKHLAVARMRNGDQGDYALVTWPGMFGALTGVAPGRFAIVVNHVTHEEDSTVRGLLSRAVGGYWPVAWAVRRAFEEAEDFEEAVDLLKDEMLLAPALLTVVGTGPKERVVIECGCDDYELREPEGKAHLLTTNHYEHDDADEWNVDLDELDTCERFARLEELLEDEEASPGALFDALSDDDVHAGKETQYQVYMQPATGRLIVRVEGRPELDVVVDR